MIEMRSKIIGGCGDHETSLQKRGPLSDTCGKTTTLVAVIIVFALGIALTLFVIANPLDVAIFEQVGQVIVPSKANTGSSPAASGDREILYWYAPMVPTEIYDKPGLSQMGMKLLPKYADEVEEKSGAGITIDPATVQNMGVLTDVVERGDLKIEIRTVGTLDYDEDNIFLVNTKYDGWIEKVYVNYVGESVDRGQPLFEIYSPDLVTTQEEYLSAQKYRDAMRESGFPDALARAEALFDAARSRLLYWDITPEQIGRLEEQGEAMRTLTVVSPASGVVVKKMDQALEGMRSKAGMNLYKIADLSSLWVHVDIYEYQLPWIKEGQEAEVEIGYYPGEAFTGKVLFFYPYLDEKTRTIKACIELPNPNGRLRPEMYATVKFTPVAAMDVTIVPEIAVLHSGERDIVVLALGEGRFEPREVRLGLQGSGSYQVLEGLEGGEEIVTSAQFLIDSESSLREAVNKMLMAKKNAAASEAMDQGSATKDMEQGSTMKMLKPVIDDAEAVEVLEKVIDAYLPIWRALAGDSIDGLERRAANFAKTAGRAAGNAEEGSLKTGLAALERAASAMETGDIEAARESMKTLSAAIVDIFESHDVRIHKKHTIIECPMVEKRWIQDEEAVMNPFYGSAMLNCGSKVGEIG